MGDNIWLLFVIWVNIAAAFERYLMFPYFNALNVCIQCKLSMRVFALWILIKLLDWIAEYKNNILSYTALIRFNALCLFWERNALIIKCLG